MSITDDARTKNNCSTTDISAISKTKIRHIFRKTLNYKSVTRQNNLLDETPYEQERALSGKTTAVEMNSISLNVMDHGMDGWWQQVTVPLGSAIPPVNPPKLFEV